MPCSQLGSLTKGSGSECECHRGRRMDLCLDHEHEELCELIMIKRSASVHVCPPEHRQENGLRKSKETRPLLTASGAEMKQHGMRQVSCDTEVGKVTTDNRVLDVRRPIWSLGSMVDSGCDVHFTKDRCWIPKDDGKRGRHDPQWRSVLRGTQTFNIDVEGSKHAGT